ncbi:MAG: class I SAM-dependent methyltransferase [Burkholderiales bacterium]|nr:class I SAM-dependent methyltransferase [Burkholderiales bacterium]
MHKLILKPGREKSLKRRHPWVFSGAIAKVEAKPQLGDSVEVFSADGAFLAVAAYSPESQIRARVWSWIAGDIDAAFFAQRVARAAAARSVSAGDSARLVHGESDGLPGVIADRYGDTVVVQLLSAGAERWRGAIADALAALPGVARVIERSDADVRALEGLPPQSGLLRGEAAGAPMIVREHGLEFAVDAEQGHKTGFYLDQRDNRLLLRGLAQDKTVLDCFCYCGGFALNALAGGAKSVTAIDSSGPALAAAKANAGRNKLPGDGQTAEWLEADVFKTLRSFRDGGRKFDIIVLDPPKLAPTAAHAEKAARAYKDINLLGFKLLNPGGLLMTYSCSGGVSPDLFQKIVAGAALDAGVDARIERWLHASADHPVALNFPEGEYLKGLLLRAGI